MKKTKIAIITAIVAVMTFISRSSGIEGLKLSIQGSDVILKWPSDPNSGETFIVQSREALDTNSTWVTLTNFYPAFEGTNLTSFVHSNAACVPTGVAEGSGGGEGGPPSPGFSTSSPSNQENSFPSLPSLPPVPWDTSTWVANNSSKLQASSSLASASENEESADEGNGICYAFYRVVRNGVYFFALTNDTTLSGIVNLPVEAAYDEGTLNSITFTANGAKVPGTDLLSLPFPSPLSFAFDTTRLANGDYSLQAIGMWLRDTINTDFDRIDVELPSPTVLVHITNEIFYPDWVGEYADDLLLIKVTSAYTNVDWQIAVYGETNDYIGSFTNHSDDGVIDFSWNLRDATNGLRTDNAFTTITTITQSGTSASSTNQNPPLVRVVDNFPEQGLWMTARADYIPHTLQNYDSYVAVQNGFAQMGESGGGVLPGTPYRNSGETLLCGTHNITNWAIMSQQFANHHEIRNFYFDGHGGPDWIGYFIETNGDIRTLGSSVIAQFLGNQMTGNTNATRFRFVWLDTCDSATGNWPQTFGMGDRENVALTNYTSRPSVFCGFDREVYGFSANGISFASINFRSYFQVYWWLFDDPIKNAFQSAKSQSGFSDAQYLKIYGYWGLHWNEFNTKGEWPLP